MCVDAKIRIIFHFFTNFYKFFHFLLTTPPEHAFGDATIRARFIYCRTCSGLVRDIKMISL